MVTKKYRTLDDYKKAGAAMRLFKAVASKLVVDSSVILSAADTDSLMGAVDRVERLCSRAEDNMFKDFPEVSNDYLSVFYGDLADTPYNEVDEEIHSKAKEIVNDIIR
ncbi:MAG: hypothetical protein DUD30_00800 [Lactobacillus sp.]|nr:MAG: hypothetical protein DUD30_00800 [Lactobacillus sp.]